MLMLRWGLISLHPVDWTITGWLTPTCPLLLIILPLIFHQTQPSIRSFLLLPSVVRQNKTVWDMRWWWSGEEAILFQTRECRKSGASGSYITRTWNTQIYYHLSYPLYTFCSEIHLNLLFEMMLTLTWCLMTMIISIIFLLSEGICVFWKQSSDDRRLHPDYTIPPSPPAVH